jgi:carboxylesterase type B
VLDGEVIPYPLEDPRVAELSKGLPTIIGCNFSENNMLPAVYANADMRYKMGDTKQYLYIFAKPSPHMDGTFATNHCTEMPFVFNNIWLGRFMVGCDKSAYKLADFMSDVWVSFAKNGVPDVKGFKWEMYNPDTKPVVVFNDKTMTVHAGDPFFDEMKTYKRDVWVYRKH